MRFNCPEPSDGAQSAAGSFPRRRTERGKRQARSGVRTMIHIPEIATGYLSSHTSSRRAPLKMLLTNTIWPFTYDRIQVPPSA